MTSVATAAGLSTQDQANATTAVSAITEFLPVVTALAGAGLSWEEALARAKPWLADAMRAGEALAVGDASRQTWHGPVDHGHAQRG